MVPYCPYAAWCREEKGVVQGICGKENSIFTEACSHCIVTSDSLWLPGVNWFIQRSGCMARTGEELEIHSAAVQLGMFSEKRSACDAICCTTSASPSRNTRFLVELWERRCCSRATFQVVLLPQWVFRAQWGPRALCNLQQLVPECGFIFGIRTLCTLGERAQQRQRCDEVFC